MANKKSILKVRIGDDIYEILTVSDVLRTGYEMGFTSSRKPKKSEEILGMVDVTTKTILIDKSQSAEEQDSTLLHEIIHTIIPDLSEEHVLQLESKLFPVLNENGFRFVDRRRNKSQSRRGCAPDVPKQKRRRR